MTKPVPFLLEVGPAAVRAPAGHAVSEAVTVTNGGTARLDISGSTHHLGGACDLLRFSPVKFSLPPGAHQAVMVTAPGSVGDYLAQFTARIHGAQGISVGGAIGSRIVVGKPTAGTICNAAKGVTGHAIGGGPPWWLWLIVAAVVVAIVAGVVALVKKRRAA